MKRACALALFALLAGCASPAPANDVEGLAGPATRMSIDSPWFEAALVEVPAERLRGLVPPEFEFRVRPGGDARESADRVAGILVATGRWNASVDGNKTFYPVSETWLEVLIDAPDEWEDPAFTYRKAILAVATTSADSFAAYDAWGIDAREAQIEFAPGVGTPLVSRNATATRADDLTIDVAIETTTTPVTPIDAQRVQWFVLRDGKVQSVVLALAGAGEVSTGTATVTIGGDGAVARALAGTWHGAGVREGIPSLGEWWPVPFSQYER